MAWTVTESFRGYANGNCVITLAMTSDTGASDYDISTYLKEIKGKFLYLMKLTPGTGGDAPSGTYDLDLEDEGNTHILDTDANSATVPAYIEGSATLGRDPMIKDVLSVVAATLGDTNKTTVELFFSDHPQVE